jgi:hypothetical protein
MIETTNSPDNRVPVQVLLRGIHQTIVLKMKHILVLPLSQTALQHSLNLCDNCIHAEMNCFSTRW